MSAPFDGYSPEGLALLGDLATFDKEQFAARKKDYTHLIANPTKAFVSALLERLQADISPDITGAPKTNGSIAPINNDLRFSPDKSPYKGHLLLRFWEGAPKKFAPTLWVRIAPDELGFATGMGFDTAGLSRFRRRIAGPEGEDFAKMVAALSDLHPIDIAGEGLRRVPKDFPADHPRGTWLKFNKGMQLRWPETAPAGADGYSGDALVDLCAQRLGDCADIHRWLVG
ncbi:MAG: DUF2461 family protein [Myxococcales bacterium]|nr:DUF2461 family protein [Myxococcales bacterium]